MLSTNSSSASKRDKESHGGIPGDAAHDTASVRTANSTQGNDDGDGLTRGAKVRRWALLGLAGAAVLATTFVAPIAIHSIGEQHAANNVLAEAQKNVGSIVLANSVPERYTASGSSVPNTSDTQFALTTPGGEVQDGGAFVFTNDTTERTKQQVNVELLLDLSSPQSRDFFLINSASLSSALQMGVATVSVQFVQSGDTFSLYAANALAELVALSSSDAANGGATVSSEDMMTAWDGLTALVRLSGDIDRDLDAEALAGMVANTLTGISVNDVQAGRFADWLVSVNSADLVKRAASTPAVRIEGNLVPEDTNFNDAPAMHKLIVDASKAKNADSSN